MNLPSNHRDAKALGITHYFTGKPCQRGHLARRFASTRQCEACVVEFKLAWRSKPENAAKDLAYCRRYNEENRAIKTAKARENYAKDPADRLAASRGWKERNAERVRAYRQEEQKRNRALYTARENERRATKVRATPPWVDRAAIAKVFEEARRLALETGVPHEVDHIVPLKGRNVCGLHVHWNLQAIPARENRRKYNLIIAGYAKCGEEVTR